MNHVLQDLCKSVSVYLDDIIFPDNLDEHNQNIREVLRRLQDAGLKFKREKCNFM